MTAPGPITRHAPGKLFVTGEYAVLEPGNPAVLVALDRLVSVTVTPAAGHDVVVSSDLHPRPVRLRWDGVRPAGVTAADDRAAGGSLAHVVAALGAVAELLAERDAAVPGCTVSVSSELHQRGTKFGLGSSGAVTVASVAAVAAHCGLQLSRDERFRLAMIASARLDARASGADLAASSWGGWVLYQAPDRSELLDLVRRDGIAAALRAVWPGLAIRRLRAPAELTLAVGWTGEPASTGELIADRPARAWRGTPAHRTFVTEMAGSVRALVAGLESGDRGEVLRQITAARRLLARLDEAAGLGIFTDRLVALCDAADTVGGAGKPSGAGGGDCGIALLDSATEPDIARLRALWAAAGVQHLPVRVRDDEMDCR